MDFSNTSGIKSPFSPRVRQSIAGRRPSGPSSAKKNQSKYTQGPQTGEIIYKTPLTIIETYGTPLPVMVTEALTFASGAVSARLYECGWCVVVRGRRVLAWQRDDAPAAWELQLPQTDLAHKADLVVLFYEDGAQMPSCIGVSPEGTVRYWASVAAPGSCVDTSCELQGQECDRLTEPQADQLVLATTTCTAVLLTLQNVDGRAGVACRTLRPPSGWLGGLGRRVSLLFFGSMPQHADTKLVNVALVSPGPILSEGGEGGAGAGGAGAGAGCVALLTHSGVLQLWQDKLTEIDVADAVMKMPGGGGAGVELVALELAARADGALLALLAALPPHREPTVRYVLATVVGGAVARCWWWRGAGPEPDAPPRLLLAERSHALYTPTRLVNVYSSSPEQQDAVELAAEGDRLLAARGALLLSARHGVLRMRHALQPPDESMCDSAPGSPGADMYEGNLSLYEIDPHEVSATSTDARGKLKSAFLFHLRRDHHAAMAIVQELSGGGGGGAARAEALQRTLVAVAAEILDDVPNGDPRWKQRARSSGRVPLGSSSALQEAAQVRDKQRALALLLAFAQRAGLLPPPEQEASGEAAETAAALLVLCCRLALAAALLALPPSPLLDRAVNKVMSSAETQAEEEEEVVAAVAAGVLPARAAVFRRVSRAPRLLLALRDLLDPAPAADIVNIFNSALAAVQRARAAWGARLGVAAAAAAAGASGLDPEQRALHRAAVSLVQRSLSDGSGAGAGAGAAAAAAEGAARLAELVLLDAAALRRAATDHLYEALRRDLILPFMSAGETERALALAEKFGEFELLIQACVQRGQLGRLRDYMHKYQDQGLPEAAYAWLASRGGRHAALLVRQLAGAGAGEGAGAARAAAWLRAAPGRKPLLALQQLEVREHAAAAAALAAMADEETESVNRMTTMASLAKLCALAGDEEAGGGALRRRVEARLALGEQHAALPRALRLHHGLDAADARVHAPDELVQMYVQCGGGLTEYDYKKALDLAESVRDPELRDDLRLRVWCACIRHDDWAGAAAAGAGAGAGGERDALQDRLFFKLIDLVHVMGGDLELVLPPLEDILTAPELAELVGDPRTHYLIKYGYECLDARAPAAAATPEQMMIEA
ncbi:nuclear pore complex protein Nup133 [Plutella xylostella]|uniref:nuclear pore complex protein Nup133 n=1 Tax=Plutella xylostella TaxID=51655 RepID=UPI0020327BF6|nr:nuclear pore complex protein Nup133 [Plutella xylostella]